MTVRRALAIAFLLLLSTAAAVAVQERLVVVGAGFVGSWDTEFELANSGNDPIWVWIGQVPRFGCLQCPGSDRSVSSAGTRRVTAQEALSGGFGSAGVQTLYVDPFIVDDTGRIVTGASQPTVTARVINRARPTQTIELPVVRYSTIQAMNPTVLAFPSARRTTDSHSNLIVAEVSNEPGRVLSILVEAYSASGERLGAATFDVPPGGILSAGTLVLVDVVSRLGIGELENGQIRVTKTGGTGLMWGLLATVYDEGRVSVSVGANP